MARAKDGLTWRGHVAISRGFIKALQAERKRTGLSPTALLQDAPEMPALLSAEMASNWMRGQTRSANPEHMAFVLAAYRKARDKRP